jgi:hypothetical protein
LFLFSGDKSTEAKTPSNWPLAFPFRSRLPPPCPYAIIYTVSGEKIPNKALSLFPFLSATPHNPCYGKFPISSLSLSQRSRLVVARRGACCILPPPPAALLSSADTERSSAARKVESLAWNLKLFVFGGVVCVHVMLKMSASNTRDAF